MAEPLLAPAEEDATSATSAPAENYADHEAIKALITRKRDEYSQGRESFIRAAYRNILYYKGHQWVLWDRGLSRFRPARLPAKHPQPVTNMFKATLKAVISVFARIEPTLTYRPGSDEPEDRATADVASRAIEVIEAEVNIRRQRQFLATWVGIANGAWLETGYDPDPVHGTRLLQHEQCRQCGLVERATEQGCPACGGPTQPAAGPDGEPIGEQVPIGKMYVDVVSPFELFFNPSITDWSRQRDCLREKLVSVDEAKSRWPGVADRIMAEASGDGGIGGIYADSLPTLGTFIGDSARRGLDAPLAGTLKHVTERWYWQLPDATYPQGLLAIALGRQAMTIVHSGRLPYHFRDGNPFLPLVHFPQEVVPGTAWPGGVADDLAAKQAQRNRWESMIETAAQAFGQGKWLIPEGSNIGTVTGEADVIRYNPLIGGVAVKPDRLAGDPMTNAFIAYLEKIDRDFEQLAGTFDIIKGARPPGVSAGIALQILQERGMSRFAPLFILWEDAWAHWASQAIEIFRQFATEPRVRRIQGRDGAWQVHKFLGADLQGRVDVVAEANSSLPRSSLADRADIDQLLDRGIISAQDPETRYLVLESYGRTSMIPGMAADTKNALMEQEAFAALAQHPMMQQITPEEVSALETLNYLQIHEVMASLGVRLPRLRPAVDDHGIHAREHRKWLKSESVSALPLLVQLIGEKMTAYHDQLAAQQMQAVMQAQAGQKMGRRAGAPNAGGPNQNPLRTGSSGKRMLGDQREMAQDQAGVA